MGTRYEDQPVEQWAGPESLDPTPVWKQYILVALLAVVSLVVLVVVGVTALAPTFVTPPALVFGDRLVLSASDLPTTGKAKLIATPIVDDARSFYLVRAGGRVLALRAHWAPRTGQPVCRVVPLAVREGAEFGTQDCAVFQPPAQPANFDLLGNPATSSATRGLDQYLVSVSGDRVIVNLSRVIESSERTSGPVPTGIPQPQAP